MVKIVLQTAATAEPVSLSELRDHLQIAHHDQDAYLERLILTATDVAQKTTWSQFVQATYDESFDAFAERLTLWKQPVISITQITYVDSAGDSQTLDTGIYELGKQDGLGIVRLKYQQSWPTTRGHPDAVTVRYVAGYGAASAVPDPIKHAILVDCGRLYEHRESLPDEKAAWLTLLRPYTFRRYKE
jgi:uncharacterized phiE125 gp8 family phage protein